MCLILRAYLLALMVLITLHKNADLDLLEMKVNNMKDRKIRDLHSSSIYYIVMGPYTTLLDKGEIN